jgi:hypothetical protein
MTAMELDAAFDVSLEETSVSVLDGDGQKSWKP